jgi:hypothetical protein
MQLGNLLVIIVSEDHCTRIVENSVQCFVSGLIHSLWSVCSAYGRGVTQLLIGYTEPLCTQ